MTVYMPTRYPQFLSPLVCQAHTEPDEWVVYYPLRFAMDPDTYWTVPRGFITDLASIPWALRRLKAFSPNGRSRKAAVLHDYLYATNWLPRKECDEVFYQALLAEGVSVAMAQLYYLGVRAGGGRHYARRSDGLIDDYDFVPDDYWSPTHV
jgi:hypothetical protein